MTARFVPPHERARAPPIAAGEGRGAASARPKLPDHLTGNTVERPYGTRHKQVTRPARFGGLSRLWFYSIWGRIEDIWKLDYLLASDRTRLNVFPTPAALAPSHRNRG